MVVCHQRGERVDWKLTSHPDVVREGTALLDVKKAFEDFASASAADPTVAMHATNLPLYQVSLRIQVAGKTTEAVACGTFEQLDEFVRRTGNWLELHRQLADGMRAKNWILYLGYDHAEGAPLGSMLKGQ